MGIVSRFAGKLSYILDIIARWLVVALMVLVVGNIILRQFGHPIAGTVEWVEFLTAMAIGLALGFCGAQGGHVALTFIIEKLNKKNQLVVEIITDFIVMIFLSVSFWKMIVYANGTKLAGQVSLTTAVPIYYFIYILAFGFLGYGLVVLGSIIDNFRKVVQR